MEIRINFGGFYGSLHEERIDDIATQMSLDHDGEESMDDFRMDLNYLDMNKTYSKNFVDFLNDELDTELEFKELHSPREYNFSTDVIYAECSDSDALKILSYTLEYCRDELKELIEDKTTSKSGYIAFYTYLDVLKRENRDILIQSCLDAIINDSEDEWEQYYDFHCVYDDVSSVAI